jgi:hypothetical protein
MYLLESDERVKWCLHCQAVIGWPEQTCPVCNHLQKPLPSASAYPEVEVQGALIPPWGLQMLCGEWQIQQDDLDDMVLAARQCRPSMHVSLVGRIACLAASIWRWMPFKRLMAMRDGGEFMGLAAEAEGIIMREWSHMSPARRQDIFIMTMGDQIVPQNYSAEHLLWRSTWETVRETWPDVAKRLRCHFLKRRML